MKHLALAAALAVAALIACSLAAPVQSGPYWYYGSGPRDVGELLDASPFSFSPPVTVESTIKRGSRVLHERTAQADVALALSGELAPNNS
jgi:hypothetical protein